MHFYHSYYNYGNYSESLFVLNRDMKILKWLMHFKFTILLISRLLQVFRGWKKTQINFLKKEKSIIVFVLHLKLRFNVFMHTFKDNFSKQNIFLEKMIFLSTRNILLTSLLKLLIFFVCNIIVLHENRIDHLILLAITLN